jgi:dihydrofolate reductase
VSIIVIGFVTLDGIMSDPTGSEGTPLGGWALRHGREAIDGDKFRLGRTMDDGVLLFGRTTWQIFSRLWPGREGPFADRMNAVPKLIASRTLSEADTVAWANSRVLEGDVIDAVKHEPRDVVVMGSLSLVHRLMAEDLVDEYRLLTFPTVLGTGDRLFPAGTPHAELACLSAEQDGPAVLTRHRRAAA